MKHHFSTRVFLFRIQENKHGQFLIGRIVFDLIVIPRLATVHFLTRVVSNKMLGSFCSLVVQEYNSLHKNHD
jgi:hypothetical protein